MIYKNFSLTYDLIAPKLNFILETPLFKTMIELTANFHIFIALNHSCQIGVKHVNVLLQVKVLCCQPVVDGAD
jgi:hypothetical protein